MKDHATPLAALAIGALAMYYFDSQSGAQRRALLVAMLRGAQRPTGRTVRRRAFHRIPSADPHSDALLRDEIRDRLGRMVSHPRALDVEVENGVVRLSGDVLAKERDGLLDQVVAMAGVQKLINAMTAHDNPATMATLEARQEAQLSS